jgi:intracellular septation protein A
VVRTVPADVPTAQHNETIVRHRSTNTGALISILVGVVVLLGGIGLVASQIHFIPWPYNIYVVLGFGFILLLLGASMIRART